MAAPCPDGISEADAHPRGGHRGRASLLPLIILAALLALALSGLLGGRPDPVQVAETDNALIEVNMPSRLRNGMSFEAIIRITAKRPVKALTLAISSSLWRDITINNMMPAAEKEDMQDGFFRFAYGAADPGVPIEIKIDGQINPPLFAGTDGEIAVYDRDVRLVGLATTMRVYP